jgi:hypothetical protein
MRGVYISFCELGGSEFAAVRHDYLNNQGCSLLMF